MNATSTFVHLLYQINGPRKSSDFLGPLSWLWYINLEYGSRAGMSAILQNLARQDTVCSQMRTLVEKPKESILLQGRKTESINGPDQHF